MSNQTSQVLHASLSSSTRPTLCPSTQRTPSYLSRTYRVPQNRRPFHSDGSTATCVEYGRRLHGRANTRPLFPPHPRSRLRSLPYLSAYLSPTLKTHDRPLIGQLHPNQRKPSSSSSLRPRKSSAYNSANHASSHLRTTHRTHRAAP